MSNEKTTRIRNGVVQTPQGPLEADVLIRGERIAALLARNEVGGADREIDADGLWVMPGIIDLHAHTRVPGYEYKRTTPPRREQQPSGV